MKALVFALLVGAAGGAHALGHLLAGWSAGIRVEEFSVGVGPVLVRLGALRIRAFPLWAYVLFEGQRDEGAWHLAAPSRRLVATLGGPLGNLVACLLLVLALGFGWGRVEAGPQDNVVHAVLPASPAERAGIRPGDRILTVDGQPWVDLESFQRLAEESRGPLRLGLQDRVVEVAPTDTRVRRVGVKVRPPVYFEPLPPAEVVPYALRTTLAMVGAPLRLSKWRSGGLLRLPDGGVLVGPSGWQHLPAAGLVVAAATLNAWLALMFCLPIPGADGMRMLIQLAQWRGAAIPTSAEERLQDFGTWALGTAYAFILMIVALS